MRVTRGWAALLFPRRKPRRAGGAIPKRVIAPKPLAVKQQPVRAGLNTIGWFGSNPGALRMLLFLPARLPVGRPLVVVLHGCRQGAASFAAEGGWIALAEQRRFALLLPEQTFENNRGRCFNWYQACDVARGRGEAMSIRQMIRSAQGRCGSDPRRIYIAGFSAGGAMTAAMLAAYPALFAAGGIVAGMPVGAAATPFGALGQMHRATGWRTRTGLADAVRSATATTTRKAWPRVTIWTGARDRTVDPANAEALAAQWSELHGHPALPAHDEECAPGIRRRAWGRPAREPSVELWTLDAIGHGFPVDPRVPGGGRPGAWVVDAGLSAARRIIEFWNLARA